MGAGACSEFSLYFAKSFGGFLTIEKATTLLLISSLSLICDSFITFSDEKVIKKSGQFNAQLKAGTRTHQIAQRLAHPSKWYILQSKPQFNELLYKKN